MRFLFLFLSFGLSQNLFANLKVEDFRKSGMSDDRVIQLALDSLGKLNGGSLEFDGSRTYILQESLILPGASNSKAMYVLKGNGCTLQAKENAVIFSRLPANQKEALDKFMKVRFRISDFQFVGGKKGIELGATYGSVIEFCNFTGQKEAAVDVQFGLQTGIAQCNLLNQQGDGIVLRTGEAWGGSANNSQSNHSVVSQCRSYSRKDGGIPFKVLGSGGVVIKDCISEGSNEVPHAIYFDRLNSTTVRYFTIENFHLEHAPVKSGIYLNHTGIAEIKGLFYQLGYKDFPLVETSKSAEQVNLSNVPHFVDGTIIISGSNEVPWRVEDCHKNFYLPQTWCICSDKGRKNQLPYYFSGRGGKYQIKKTY